MDVILTLEPGRLGQNQFDVHLTNSGQPVANAREVSLRFTFLGHAMGASNADAAPSGGGHYRAEGGYLGIEGPWQIEVAIRRPDAFDAFAPFRVEAQANGGIQPIGGQASFSERLAGFLTQSGGGLTGVFLALFAVAWAFLATRAAKWRWQVVPLLVPAIIVSWIAGLQLTTFFQEYTPAKFATNPILTDEASIARGQALYATHCIACHGPEGRGNGPAAAGLSPPPADFTAGHTESHPDGDLYYWIKEGFPGSAMPAFSSQLKDEDVWHLVNHVRRLSAQGNQMQMESGMPMPP
jgi:mono/diheme cytochrome c family protein